MPLMIRGLFEGASEAQRKLAKTSCGWLARTHIGLTKRG